MKFSQKIYCLVMLLGLLSAGSYTFSQVTPVPTAPLGGFNLFGGQQMQQQSNTNQTNPNQDGVDPPKKDDENAADMKKNLKLEIENKYIALQKERIELERELAALAGSGDTSEQGAINIAIKKKNLQLLYLKEQYLLQAELERYGYYEKELPEVTVFGQQYFRNPRMRLINTPEDISPSESYILGTGDQIQVDIWGQAGYSGSYVVDGAGFVTIPKLQKVYLKGKSLTEAREILRSGFTKIVNLSGSNFDVSVSGTRTITVHVTGEVFYPGTYTLPALNSAFNILTLAGGPTNMGSLRNVFIQRGGVIVDSFDLYQYLFGGKKGSEIFMQNNDYLIVPTIGKVVSIGGGIRRASKYELKPQEGFAELLSYAGGFIAKSYIKDMVVNRIVDHQSYDNFSFNWDSISSMGKNFKLYDGDVINIKEISLVNLFVAKINGGVNTTGVYKIRKGERIADLIDRANGLHRDAYEERAYLVRTNADMTKSFFVFKPIAIMENKELPSNIELEENDEIIIFTIDQFRENAFVTSDGFVRKPVRMDYIKGLKVSDLIKLSGGIANEAYTVRAIIERINPDFTLAVIPIDFDAQGNIINDVELERNDVLNVYPKPTLKDRYSVDIYGEVNLPGSKAYRENMSLKDIIIMAGGIKGIAEYSSIEIASVVYFDSIANRLIPLPKTTISKYNIGTNFDLDKTSERIFINPLDQIFIRKAYFDEQKVVFLGGEVKYPGVYAIASKGDRILDIVERAGGFTKFAFLSGARYRRVYGDTQSVRVIVNFKKAIRRPRSRFNYVVTGRDSLIVPLIDQTVRITGSVENKSEDFISTYYAKGRRAKFYITRMAGGFNENAFKRKVYVQYANGQNVRTKNFVLFKVYPKVRKGSIVYVPEKESKKGKKLNLDASLSRVLTLTTTILTLFALINLATTR